jgi:hypothetical protein
MKIFFNNERSLIFEFTAKNIKKYFSFRFSKRLKSFVISCQKIKNAKEFERLKKEYPLEPFTNENFEAYCNNLNPFFNENLTSKSYLIGFPQKRVQKKR